MCLVSQVCAAAGPQKPMEEEDDDPPEEKESSPEYQPCAPPRPQHLILRQALRSISFDSVRTILWVSVCGRSQMTSGASVADDGVNQYRS